MSISQAVVGAWARRLSRKAPLSRLSSPHRLVSPFASAVGDKIPAGITLNRVVDGKPSPVQSEEFFAGKKIVLFSVPGAFTPTCHREHMPGFIANADAIKAKGVDSVVCCAVNDAFVLSAWAEALGAGDKIELLSDGSAKLATALGLELDLTAAGMGVRMKRTALVVNDGVIEQISVDLQGLSASKAEEILAKL